jgi:hypothetical protein
MKILRNAMKRAIVSAPTLAVTIFLVIALEGCAAILEDISFKDDMWEVLKLKEEGTAEVYEVTPDQAWEIAKKVFHWEGADPMEEHKGGGYMLTRKREIFHPKIVMGAWIDSVDDGTKVTVVKRRIRWGEMIAFSETTFHRRFAQAVEIVKRGGPLPDSPPDLRSSGDKGE